MAKTALSLLFPIVTLFLTSHLHAAVIHVDGVNGIDSGTCGALSDPCKTIRKAAYTDKTEENIIKVTTGRYEEIQTIEFEEANIGLTIRGGYNESFSSRICDPGRTEIVLSPTSTRNRILGFDPPAPGTVTVTLECLGFKAAGDNALFGIMGRANGLGAKLNVSLKKCSVTSFLSNGLYFSSSDGGTTNLTIEESYISDNHKDTNTGLGGAGLYFALGDGGTGNLDMMRSHLVNNHASNAGGGARLSAPVNGRLTANLTNNIIANNTGTIGGGLYINSTAVASPDGFAIKLLNNTIVNNNAVNGGGLYITSLFNTLAVDMRNTIVFNNISTPDSGNDIYLDVNSSPGDDSGLKAWHSIVGDLKVVSGNYKDSGHNSQSDPELNSAYHLRAGSPAIDSGVCGFNLFTYIRIAPEDDIDGDLRPGFGKLTGCDIGADEYKRTLCFPVKNSANDVSIICF